MIQYTEINLKHLKDALLMTYTHITNLIIQYTYIYYAVFFQYHNVNMCSEPV